MKNRFTKLLAFTTLLLTITAAGNTVRETPVVRAVKTALPWVVNIGTEVTVRVNDPYIVRLNDYYYKLYKNKSVSEYTPLGSGIIVDEAGLVLTNWHVTRAAEKLILRLYDGSTFPANIVGFDAQCDLCLLKLEGDFTQKKLTSATFAKADDLMLGETVITLGNPYGLEHSVSQGVLSAINRSLENSSFNDMLQTDAAINPGNSGGPLINLDGDVIGINQAIRSDAQGIGFAIPTKRLEQFLVSWLIPETFSTATMGCTCRMEEDNVVFSNVIRNSPADKAGIKDGDIIASVNNRKIYRILDFAMATWPLKEGNKADICLKNGRQLSVTLKKMTADELIAKRLGIRVQKLTKSLNMALELPEDTEGLAVSEIMPEVEYRNEETQLRKYIKRGDLLLYAGEGKVTNINALASVLKDTISGTPLKVGVAIMGNDGRYHIPLPITILLQ